MPFLFCLFYATQFISDQTRQKDDFDENNNNQLWLHVEARLSAYNCHDFLEPPGAPGEPSIVDFDNKSVTLRWGKPKDTGGRPISHYIIQKKDKFGGWFDALITDDLVTNKPFFFGIFCS